MPTIHLLIGEPTYPDDGRTVLETFTTLAGATLVQAKLRQYLAEWSWLPEWPHRPVFLHCDYIIESHEINPL